MGPQGTLFLPYLAPQWRFWTASSPTKNKTMVNYHMVATRKQSMPSRQESMPARQNTCLCLLQQQGPDTYGHEVQVITINANYTVMTLGKVMTSFQMKREAGFFFTGTMHPFTLLQLSTSGLLPELFRCCCPPYSGKLQIRH